MNIEDSPVFEDYKIMSVSLVVSEKNILAMSGLDVFPILFGLADGGQGRVLVNPVRNIQLIQFMKHVIGWFFHNANIGNRRGAGFLFVGFFILMYRHIVKIVFFYYF